MGTAVLPLVGTSGRVLGVDSTSGTAAPPTNVSSGVTAGTYGDATHVARVTVDDSGYVTNAVEVLISAGGGVSRAKGRFVYG